MITNEGINKLRDVLHDDINYIAVGSSAAIIENPTQLGAEIFRAQITNRDKTGIGITEAMTSLLDSDGSLAIREIGIFANGTELANSGVLISRMLWTRDKTAAETIQINRIDTIRRG